jgi:hypothetical protein
VSAPDLDALYAQAEAEAVDALMRRRFRVAPVEDRSGLLGQPSGTSSAEASEDEQFEAYMRRHFPGSVR